jgi:hypothetical protein
MRKNVMLQKWIVKMRKKWIVDMRKNGLFLLQALPIKS